MFKEMQELVLLHMQELRLEVYQTCTARKISASKVAFGVSASQRAAPQDTLLGTATAPLTDVLTKPQACSHTALFTLPFCDNSWHPTKMAFSMRSANATKEVVNSEACGQTSISSRIGDPLFETSLPHNINVVVL